MNGLDLGLNADIIVSSFGVGKAVNLGKGGFLSFKNKELCDESKEILENSNKS